MLDRFLPQVRSIPVHLFESLVDSLLALLRNLLTRMQPHDKQNGNPNRVNRFILPALVLGLVRWACIVSSGILGTGSLLRGCWLLGQRLGYVELMCFGGGGRRRRFLMEAWRTLEWRMATRWKLTRRRRKRRNLDLLVNAVSVSMNGIFSETCCTSCNTSLGTPIRND